MDLFGIGTGEVIMVLVVALLIFKPAKVVELGRSLGKTLKAIKKSTSDLTSTITREIEEEKNQVVEVESKNPPSSEKS